jgi:hypothetical protein
MMSSKSRNLAVIAAVACGLVPTTAARAQWYSADPRPAPAYAYKVQPQRPHVVKVAPNTYVIRHSPRRESQRALIDELRRRSRAKHKVITRTRIVRGRSAVIGPRRVVDDSPRVIERRREVFDPPRVIEHRRVVYDPPRVIEHRRVVDDPPRVIERYQIVEDCPTHRGLFQPGGWLLSSHCCRCNGY